MNYAIIEFSDGEKFSIINPTIKMYPEQTVKLPLGNKVYAQESNPPGEPYRLPDETLLFSNPKFILSFVNVPNERLKKEKFRVGPIEFIVTSWSEAGFVIAEGKLVIV